MAQSRIMRRRAISTATLVSEAEAWWPPFDEPRLSTATQVLPNAPSSPRLRLVESVRRFTPYPIDEASLELDLAAACLEAGQVGQVDAILSQAHAESALRERAEQVLGDGDLTRSHDVYRRAVTLAYTTLDDIAALVVHVAKTRPSFRQLSSELARERAIREREGRASDEVLVSSVIAARALPHVRGEGDLVNKILRSRLDLRLVPARLFAWSGPEFEDVVGVLNSRDDRLRLSAPLASPVSRIPHLTAYVINRRSGAVDEQPAQLSGDGKRVEAFFRVEPRESSQLVFGIRLLDIPLDVDRACGPDVLAERLWIESWCLARFAAAAALVENIEPNSPRREWHQKSPEVDAAMASDVVQASPLRSRVDRRALARYINERLWDRSIVREGPSRPLMCEISHVMSGAVPVGRGEW